MKMKLIITMVFLIRATGLFAQTPAKIPDIASVENQNIEEQNFKLFPTKNIWTFIKLDTRNGKMWQVQFGLNGLNRMETVLTPSPLMLDGAPAIKGRYNLYPTENIFNFILLDQIDGYVYQVQWSQNEENRRIYRIY
jgi:hypothetical protein